MIILFLLFGIHIVFNQGRKVYIDKTTGNELPSKILEFSVRLDTISGKPVSRGRFELLGGLKLDAARKPVPLNEFKEKLQCAPFEPALFERLLVLKLIPYTKQSLKTMCVHLENRCEPWSICQDQLPEYEAGKGECRLDSDFLSSPSQGKLLRILNNRLYLDFPWKIERFTRVSKNIVDPINHILNMTLLQDAVWFHAEEYIMDKHTSVLPSFAFSASVKSGTMPWPWAASLTQETTLYHHLRNSKQFVDTYGFAGVAGAEHAPIFREHWHKRRSLAAFYGSMTGAREMIFDMANAFPDAIYAAWVTIDSEEVSAWNPLSPEVSSSSIVDTAGNVVNKSLVSEVVAHPPPAGYLKGYLRNKRPNADNGLFYFLNFKYTLVLVGNGGSATADRLSWLLAHSGSVVMLQASQEFLYSFSPRLIPFVHFIPIMYTGADIVEKVRWLQANDDLALRIVENARNFGKSYLRLEDHYCYMATALEEVGKLCKDTDVVVPFGDAATYMVDLSEP